MEQRTRLISPKWWIKGIQPENSHTGSTDFRYAERVIEASATVVSLGDRELRLTHGQYRSISQSGDVKKHVAAIIDSPRSYLACFDDYGGFGFDLYCLDSASGRTVWKSKVWAMGDYHGRIVYTKHDAQIERSADLVVVWGSAEGGGAYVEAFDAGTGRSQFRFCSEWW